MSDTSTSQQRAAFCASVENGRPSTSLATAVSASPAVLPDTTAALLNLGSNATYVQAATLIALRLANGGAFF